jgi:hypothetical protein
MIILRTPKADDSYGGGCWTMLVSPRVVVVMAKAQARAQESTWWGPVREARRGAGAAWVSLRRQNQLGRYKLGKKAPGECFAHLA